jgi:hypothetical protein
MLRFFKPAVENLDSIISLSAMGHNPVVHHKPPVAHVHHSTVQAPPHQVQTNSWTGTLVSGYVVVERVNAVTPNGTVATLSGTGSLNVDRQPNAVRFAMQLNGDQTGTLVITRLDGSQITASVLTLADGSAGGYQITSATGSWSQVSGTGIFRVGDLGNGTFAISFNAHQKQ